MSTNALDDRSFRDALPDVETLNRIQVEYDFSAGTGAVHDIMMPHASGRSDSIPHFVFIKVSIPTDAVSSTLQHVFRYALAQAQTGATALAVRSTCGTAARRACLGKACTCSA